MATPAVDPTFVEYLRNVLRDANENDRVWIVDPTTVAYFEHDEELMYLVTVEAAEVVGVTERTERE